MKLRNRLTGAALVGTLAIFGLAACSSDDSGDSDSTNDSSSDTGESDAGSDDSADAGGDKPSKEEVVAGFSEAFTTQSGGQIPADLVSTIVTCLVDEIYDDISDESAQELADGKVVTDPEDQPLVATASGTCTTQAFGG
ncbi:hypothetical protein [Aeromicrobium sp. Sec7.5]|uniref:hypothetical protein n=1 Tax=Aeromicrobium sp. Sec7.5 TaxID=3121276 RepID=UPI002FE4D8D4